MRAPLETIRKPDLSPISRQGRALLMAGQNSLKGRVNYLYYSQETTKGDSFESVAWRLDGNETDYTDLKINRLNRELRITLGSCISGVVDLSIFQQTANTAWISHYNGDSPTNMRPTGMIYLDNLNTQALTEISSFIGQLGEFIAKAEINIEGLTV